MLIRNERIGVLKRSQQFILIGVFTNLPVVIRATLTYFYSFLELKGQVMHVMMVAAY